MSSSTFNKHIVSGPFGFIGSSITKSLLESGGVTVSGVTNRPASLSPFGDLVKTTGYDFDEPDKMASFMEGSKVFYNTYWIRNENYKTSFEEALNNTKSLLFAAKKAGVSKVVHISVVNPNPSSPYRYYRYKALAEDAVKKSGINYTILRPPMVFGTKSNLVNNIVWGIKRFLVLPISGQNSKISLAYVEDVAKVAVEAGLTKNYENETMDVVNGEVMSYRELFETISSIAKKKRLFVPVPLWLNLSLSYPLGKLTKEPIFVAEEMRALIGGYLYSSAKPLLKTSFKDWLKKDIAKLGNRFHKSNKR